MLYKKNSTPSLNDELFKNPTSEYRGTPFWAWNNNITKEELERQIEVFNEMGLGGFHMHVRTGLKNQYLGEEFMGLVKACVEKAKNEKSRTLVQPRAGVPLINDQITLLTYLENAGADFVPSTIDSYTRQNRYLKKERKSR
mgnify:CR=1 FL=1